VTVENPKVVDFVSVENDGGPVVLTISDHLNWADAPGHIGALQEKVNWYLAFIESGELSEQYPQGTGRPVRINVVLKHAPSAKGEEFLKFTEAVVTAAGFAFAYQVLNDVQ